MDGWAQAGDALFIPEGWWHQVSSAPATIAVNFWWASPFTRSLGGPMDAYYLRRAFQSLTEHARCALIAAVRPLDSLAPPSSSSRGVSSNGASGTEASEVRMSCTSGVNVEVGSPLQGLAVLKAAVQRSVGSMAGHPRAADDKQVVCELQRAECEAAERQRRGAEDSVGAGSGVEEHPRKRPRTAHLQLLPNEKLAFELLCSPPESNDLGVLLHHAQAIMSPLAATRVVNAVVLGQVRLRLIHWDCTACKRVRWSLCNRFRCGVSW